MSTQDNKEKNMNEYEIDTLTNDRLIKDHSYDGIQELDNDLPPWWKWLFYLTIVFAVVYLVRLWVFDADDLYQGREYISEMEEASVASPEKTAEFEMALLIDNASLAAGKETFDKVCSVCHLLDGGGLVGPNFTDDYWIHGNTVEDMFEIVSNGVLEKGMIAYKDQMSNKARLEVISYIALKLYGTTPANPKAPEGELLEWPH
jgi:cytochrome c oxidase cbb3-type subunit 3